jgi:hypothetical protein
MNRIQNASVRAQNNPVNPANPVNPVQTEFAHRHWIELPAPNRVSTGLTG